MRKSRKFSRRIRKNWRVLASLGAATAAVVGILLFLSMQRGAELDNNAADASKYTPPPPAVQVDAAPPVTPLVRPADRPLRVLIAGDSLSQGRFATAAEEAYVPRLESALDLGGPTDVDVIGNSGFTADQVTPQVPQEAYDLVVLELGTNDAMKEDPQAFRQNYTALIEAVRKASPEARLLCAGSWQTDYRASSVDPNISRRCRDNGGTFVPLNPLYNREELRGPDKHEGVYGVGDNFHPNSIGHEAIATELLAALTPQPE